MDRKRFRGLTFWAAFALTVCVGAVFASGAGARSAVVGISSCDQDLAANTSYIVLSNLTCENSNGFVVSGNNVNLNLNGKTVFLEEETGHSYSDGVDNTNGWTNLTVWNGTLKNWCTGIDNFADGTGIHATFKNLNIITSDGYDNNTYDQCTDSWGIYGFGMHATTITNVTVTYPGQGAPNNPSDSATGVELDCGAFNKVTNSLMNMWDHTDSNDTYGVVLNNCSAGGAIPKGFSKVKGFVPRASLHTQQALHAKPRATHWLTTHANAGPPTVTPKTPAGCGSAGEIGDVVNGVTVNQATDEAFYDDCGVGNTFSYDVSQGSYGETYGFEMANTAFDTVKNNMALSGFWGFEYYENYALYSTLNLGNGNSEFGFEYEDNGYGAFPGDHANYNHSDGFNIDFDYYSSFTGNQSNRNDEAGYYFDGPHKSVITGNFANKNGDDNGSDDSGFYFTGSSSDVPALVSHNGAFNNTGYGFYNNIGSDFLNGAGNQASQNGAGDCFLVNCP